MKNQLIRVVKSTLTDLTVDDLLYTIKLINKWQEAKDAAIKAADAVETAEKELKNNM